MSEAEFFDCTPAHFVRRRRAWLENRPGMEEARFIAFHVMKAAGYKVRRLTQIVRFPWEKAVRRVDLEPWDSPAMLKFSEEADEALKILNPEAWEKYMEGKRQREAAATLLTETAIQDADFQLNEELTLD